MSPLNYRQRLFIASYLGAASGNATEAARIAGYSYPSRHGSRLMAKPAIRAAIDAKIEGAGMHADETLARLSEIAGGDIGNFIVLEPGGDGWRFDIPKAKRAGRTGIIRKIKHRVEHKAGGGVVETVEVEMYSKLDALDKLLRFHGAYKDKVDVTSGGEAVQTVFYLPSNGRDPELDSSPVRLAELPGIAG